MAALLNPHIEHHLETIYKGTGVSDLSTLASELITLMRLDNIEPIKNRYINHWDEKDSILICYGDSVLEPDQKPLTTLKSSSGLAVKKKLRPGSRSFIKFSNHILRAEQ